MIANFSPGRSSLAVDSRRLLQFTTAIFVVIGHQLGVLVRIASSNLERRFGSARCSSDNIFILSSNLLASANLLLCGELNLRLCKGGSHETDNQP